MSRKRRARREEKGGIDEALRSYRPVLRFLFLFVLSVILLNFLYERWLLDSRALAGYGHLTARTVYLLLNLFGEAKLEGDYLVWLEGSLLYVAPACTNAIALIIYCSAVLAYPAGWKKKGIGLASGMGVLYVTNVIRLVSLGVIGSLMPGRFEMVHVFVWQGVFIVFGIVLWMAWIDRVVR